ncbi:hypothetical protein RE428_38540 [Marinobacter nanhaiticus D15-8W]|uniref:Uncharacterized protein n=1 Tax=Marinobacter nanhaiticus D15-8W TaxID=626887 RepID=N6WXI7_9GAMM|nr:hypothetical protein [Marinobacter nanhaiticus]ENO16306.1 hypothetical protein J057_13156 [Marinobacter nanhaiticus D15-8W]BES72836.1 hypothetical protein RE428_38540 [Marinobacter nanhaiticus D15-8W]
MGFFFRKKKGAKLEYPASLIEEAKKQPNGWVYEIDARYDPDGLVPPEGIKGGWKVDEHGELTGEYKANPRYRSENI